MSALTKARFFGLACLAASAFASAPLLAQASCTDTAAAYDAEQAWRSFEEQLRLDYAYLDRAGPGLADALARTRERALKTTTAQQLADVLQPFARIFGDPHFNVGPDCADDYAYVPSASDLWAVYRAGRYVLADVRAGSVADARGIRPGSEVVAISGLPAAQAALAPFDGLLGRPTDRQREYGLNVALTGKLGKPRQITLRRDGALLTMDLPDGYTSVRRPPGAPLISVDRIGKVAVIRPNDSLGRNEVIAQFTAAIASIADSSGLILDLRGTPGGGNSSVARGIMGHFTDRERPFQVHVYPYEQRRYGVVRKAVEYVAPLAPFYAKPVIVLGGRWTGSMGEGLMIGMDALGATTIGSPLADLLGGGGVRNLFNAAGEQLPVNFFLANEALFHVDGRPREDFTPKIALGSADRDALGADPAMTAALRVLGAGRASRGSD